MGGKWRSKLGSHTFQFWLFTVVGLGPNDYKMKWQRKFYDIYSFAITIMYIAYDFMTISEMMYDFSADYGFTLLRFSMLLIAMAISCKRGALGIEGRKDIQRLDITMREIYQELRMKNIKWVSSTIDLHLKLYNKIFFWFYILGLVTSIIFIGTSSYLRVPLFPLPYEQFYEVFGYLVHWWQCVMIIFTYLNFISWDMVLWSFLSRLTTYQDILYQNWILFGNNFPSINYENYIIDYKESTREVINDNTELIDFATNIKLQSYDTHMEYDKNLMRKSAIFIRESCIRYESMMRLLSKVGKLFSVQLLIHFSIGVFVVALMTVSVILGDIANMGSHRIVCFLACALFDIFVYCYYGTKVQDQHLLAAGAVFSCPWYEMNLENRKAIISVIHSLQHKGIITAGGFFPVNFATCLSFYKISYNFMALLQSAT